MTSLASHLCFLLLFAYSALAAKLAEVLAQTPELSTLNTVLTSGHPEAATGLNQFTGTFFAPSNDALNAYISTLDPNTPTEVIAALIEYHLVPKAVSVADLSAAGGVLLETLLAEPNTYANIGGGANVLFVSAYGSTGLDSKGDLKVYSGVGPAATVSKPDVAFDGGFVQIIDHVLNLPQSGEATAKAAGLTIAATFVQKSNLTSILSDTPSLTLFIPTDDAFKAAGVDVSQLTQDQINDALKYHIISGTVGYSTALQDGKDYQTLLGAPVTVHKKDGKLLVNDAPVQQGNVIFRNGVAHIIGGLLHPATPSEPTHTA